MLRSCALASVVASGLVGCALDFDGIGFTGGGGAGGGGAGASGTGSPTTSTEKSTSATMPVTCGVDQDCVPAPPTGWIGPGVWGPIGDGCGFDQVPILTAGESVNPDVCPCEPSGFTCNGGVIDLFSAPFCSEPSLVGDNLTYPAPGSCPLLANSADGLQSAKVLMSPSVASEGSCMLATGAVPTPTVVNGSLLCGLTSQPSCGSGFACSPSGSPACIAIEDPTMTGKCPSDTYPNMVARPKSGTQACDCSLNTPSGTCHAELWLYEKPTCDDAVAIIDTSGTGCPPIDVSSGDVYAELMPLQNPTCGEGTAVVDPRTWLVCCQ